MAADLTQKELATTLGVSVSSLKNWERNRNKPAKSLWAKMHQFLRGGCLGSAKGIQSDRSGVLIK
jgi:DNA-binding XRE family transcriptional regulator